MAKEVSTNNEKWQDLWRKKGWTIFGVGSIVLMLIAFIVVVFIIGPLAPFPPNEGVGP